MSYLAVKRIEFADALNTVDNVNGYAYRPTVTKAADAWPSIRNAEHTAGGSYTFYWTVNVLLNTDEGTANKWVDYHVNDIVDALEKVAFIEGFQVIDRAERDQQRYLTVALRSE